MANEPSPGKRLLKIVLLGDYSVGKTAVAKRYSANAFEREYRPSIGVDILSRCLQLDQGNVQLQIWDMSGQTEFRRLRQQYLEATDCALIVFDLTRRSSLDAVPSWVEEAREFNPKLPAVLVGNKADMAGTRTVTEDEAASLAKSLRMLFYVETSAKSGDNIDQVFKEVAKQLVVPGRRPERRRAVSTSRRQPSRPSAPQEKAGRRRPSAR